MTGESAQDAERNLDAFADELLAQGLQEFVDFYMPHRVVMGESPLPASEIYGIRYDEEVGGFRVFYRDMGVKRILMEHGTWDAARALYLEKIGEQSAYLRGRS
jgi:hypothetical protein